MENQCQNNGLNDIWGDIWGNITGGADQALDSVDKTRQSLDQTTATVQKVMKEVDSMIVWLKPVSIVAGVMITTLIAQEIYLNHKEISKK